MSGISERFTRITREEAAELAGQLASAWQHPDIPLRQWSLVAEEEIRRFAAGERPRVFSVLVDMLKRIPPAEEIPSLLEVGCASAYYSQILRLGGFDCHYEGCDYSEAFGRLAARLFPEVRFHLADATALPFPDGSFDIVLSGCCLVHIFDYERAISEAARVSRGWVVCHRTPLTLEGESRFYVKEAYSERCLEIHFSDSELNEVFRRCGLELIDSEDIFCDFSERYRHSTIALKKVAP